MSREAYDSSAFTMYSKSFEKWRLLLQGLVMRSKGQVGKAFQRQMPKETMIKKPTINIFTPIFLRLFRPLLRECQRNLRHNVWSHPRYTITKNEQFCSGMTICFVLNFTRKKFRRAGSKELAITWQNQNSGLTPDEVPKRSQWCIKAQSLLSSAEKSPLLESLYSFVLNRKLIRTSKESFAYIKEFGVSCPKNH